MGNLGLCPEPHQGLCPWTPDKLFITDPGIGTRNLAPSTALAAVRRHPSSGLSITSWRALSRRKPYLASLNYCERACRLAFSLCCIRRIFALIDGLSQRGVFRDLSAFRQPFNLNSIELSIRLVMSLFGAGSR